MLPKRNRLFMIQKGEVRDGTECVELLFRELIDRVVGGAEWSSFRSHLDIGVKFGALSWRSPEHGKYFTICAA